MPLRPTYPLYKTQQSTYPSPRSGLTRADVERVRNAAKRTEPMIAETLVPQSEEATLKAHVLKDLADLELRAQSGSRFEVEQKYCQLQHHVVSAKATAFTKEALLAVISEELGKLRAQFPLEFNAAKDLLSSAHQAVDTAGSIAQLHVDLRKTSNANEASALISERYPALANQAGPFQDDLVGVLRSSWLDLAATHATEEVRDLMATKLQELIAASHSQQAARSSANSESGGPTTAVTYHFNSSTRSSRGASSGAKVAKAPLNKLLLIATQQRDLMKSLARHEPMTRQSEIFESLVRNIRGLPDALDRATRLEALILDLSAAEFRQPGLIKSRLPKADELLGTRPVRLPQSTVQVLEAIDSLLEDLLPLRASDLGERLLLRDMPRLIDQIVHDSGGGTRPLFAKLGRGLGELRLAHPDPEVRAEMGRVLRYCFKQSGDTWPINGLTGADRLRMRVELLLNDGHQFDPLDQDLEAFALQLVNDINSELGGDSPLIVRLMDGIGAIPGLEELQLKMSEAL